MTHEEELVERCRDLSLASNLACSENMQLHEILRATQTDLGKAIVQRDHYKRQAETASDTRPIVFRIQTGHWMWIAMAASSALVAVAASLRWGS